MLPGGRALAVLSAMVSVLCFGTSRSAQSQEYLRREYIHFGSRVLAIVPPSTLSVSDAAVLEGNTGTSTLVFTVSLSSPLSQTVTVNYATSSGTATAGTDYQAASGLLTFSSQMTTQVVNVTVFGDVLNEAPETLFLTLSGATGATISRAVGTGVIIDNESAGFYTVLPCRIVDTRGPLGDSGGPVVPAGHTRTFPVTGLCGIPATAEAVAYVVTAVGSTHSGHLRAFPAGAPLPGTAAISFNAGGARSSNGIVTLGVGGKLTVQAFLAQESGQVHVVIDVSGYFQ